jgi:hypothetical protein
MMCKKTNASSEEKKHPSVLFLKLKHPSVTTSVYASTPKPVAAARPIVRGKPSEPSCKFN